MKTRIIMIIALMFFLIRPLGVHSQDQKKESWTLIETVNKVSVYYEEGGYTGEHVIFLKIVNNNPEAKTVSYSFWGDKVIKSIEVKGREALNGKGSNGMKELIKIIPKGKTTLDLKSVITVK